MTRCNAPNLRGLGANDRLEAETGRGGRVPQRLDRGLGQGLGEPGIDRGARDEPRYQAIAVTGSLPVYDPRFERALALGGRLFVVVGTPPVMEARLVTRTAVDAWLSETLFETSIEPLRNATPATRFRF